MWTDIRQSRIASIMINMACDDKSIMRKRPIINVRPLALMSASITLLFIFHVTHAFPLLKVSASIVLLNNSGGRRYISTSIYSSMFRPDHTHCDSRCRKTLDSNLQHSNISGIVLACASLSYEQY